jgi:hypothetical protein
MRKFAAIILAAGILSAGSLFSTAQAGCYRLGETGYHWYHFCLGPHFVYPHHRICHNGYCYYR